MRIRTALKKVYRIRVKVTPEHIARGLRMSMERCPVALAIQDAARGTTPRVQTRIVMVGYDVYALPKSATKFIYNFDRLKKRKKPRPFYFFLSKRLCL